MPIFSRNYLPPGSIWTPKRRALFDAAGAGSVTLTPSWAHTINGNLILAVVSMETYQTATATVGATSMTSLGFAYNNNVSARGGQQWFYLLNSGLKGAQTISASFGTAPTYCAASSVSYSNVTQFPAGGGTIGLQTPTGTFFGQSAGFTGTLVGPANGIIVQAFTDYSGVSGYATLYNGNSRYNSAGATESNLVIGDVPGSEAGFSFTATSSSGAPYFACAGVAIA